MNFKKTLQHYYNKRIDAIISTLKLDNDAFTKETFHHVRVEIKKLRAFFRLLDASVENFPVKKLETPFVKLFKQIGIVREMQIEHEWLIRRQTKTPVKAYTNYLEKKIAAEIDQFLKMKDKVRKQVKNIGSKAFTYIDHIKKKQAFGYLKKKGKKVEGLLSSSAIGSENNHQLRKQLKSYVYLLKALEEEDDHVSYKKLDELQDLLGKWHDNRVMADHFAAVPAGVSLTKINCENLARLSKTLDSHSKRQHKQIASFAEELTARSGEK